MGKKGKRSKQKDAKKEAVKIIGESDRLMDEAWDNQTNGLFSKAANQYRKVIQLLESKKELMVYTRDQHLFVCVPLMILEYRRRNYKAALDCCNYHMTHSSKSRHSRSKFQDCAILYHQLIMLRLNGQECQLSDFIHFISQKERDLVLTDAVLVFRAHKMYDSAIQLEMTFQSQKWSTTLERKLSLALTYLEQYRVEFNQRSEMRKEDIRRIHKFINSLVIEYPPFKGGGSSSYATPEYFLVLAQWYYLTCIQAIAHSKISKKDSIDTAARMVYLFIFRISTASSDEDLLELKMGNCCTCGQAVTPTEVQYVCSGCRVARYCSIEHQRMTWKKEAVQGLRIGHEILCPLYKACRKYAHAKNIKDEEKESGMKRRFDRECVRFIEYGLGLKDKCFPCEYQSMSESWI